MVTPLQSFTTFATGDSRTRPDLCTNNNKTNPDDFCSAVDKSKGVSPSVNDASVSRTPDKKKTAKDSEFGCGSVDSGIDALNLFL